jgi:hypothetical protein
MKKETKFSFMARIQLIQYVKSFHTYIKIGILKPHADVLHHSTYLTLLYK